jgi:hypothetical protein
MLNLLVLAWVRLGLPPKKFHKLTIRGRKSGRLYSIPIAVMKANGERWLVSPYGEREWVKNARVIGRVILSRGGHSETVAVQEMLDPVQSAPVLRRYLAEEPVTRRFFNVTLQSPMEDFVAEAPHHPVFRIVETAA